MTDQTLSSFDPETPSQEAPVPRKPRPRLTRQPAKKAKRAAPLLKPAKRVPKKRRVRKIGKSSLLAAPYKPVDMAVQFTPDVYRLIAEMMKLPTSERGLTIAIVQGLSGK